MHTILQEIIKKKKEDLIQQKNVGVTLIVTPKYDKGHKKGSHSFMSSISSVSGVSIIAEIKLSSPSEGILGSKAALLERAISYEKAGANAISFVTEPHYFKGDISYIEKIKERVSIPILQKDFVIDEQQVYEAKMVGSDALLLIARLVSKEVLKKFVLLCQQLSIEPVVEINSEEDLSKAVETDTNIIAVNARDLTTFVVNVDNACLLMKKIPQTFKKLGFSGIHSKSEVEKYKEAGASGVLVGTELMRTKNIQAFVDSIKM